MNKAIAIFFSLFLLSACVSLKKTSLPYKSSAFLVKKSQQYNLDYNWFSAKMGGTVFLDDKAIPLNANIRMQKDSVIWISASALLGIEAARILITPDSFQMINRLNSTYISSDISSLKEKFGINLSFEQLQNKLIGNLDLEQSNWTSTMDSANYILSNINNEILTKVKLNPSFLGVEWNQTSYLDNSILLIYSNFSYLEQGYLPQKIFLNIRKDNSEIKLNYSYSKIVLDKKKKTKFTIPSGYEPVL